MRGALVAAVLALVVSHAEPAAAQPPLVDALSFLLTNRSVSTGDFAGDAAAAGAARDTMAGFLLAELTALPINSPAGGFTYRLDPTLGTDVRSSRSFGPFFVERSLTAGKGQGSFGFGHTVAAYANVDGRNLRAGSFVATASRLTGEAEPFDTETLTLRLRTRTLTVSGQLGVTDRLDVSAAIPLVTVSFNGQRVDTYRGTAVVQATAVASASGIGDVLLRAKYNAWRHGASGVAVAGDVRLPTGDAQNLTGGGQAVVIPRLIGSVERDRVAAHGNVAYSMGGPSNELDFAGAVTVVADSRLTLIAELLGRRLETGGRLGYATAAHPDLTGVETIRLIGTPDATVRLAMVAGFRWNIAERWLLNANVVRTLTSPGLNARWVPSLAFDYFLGD